MPDHLGAGFESFDGALGQAAFEQERAVERHAGWDAGGNGGRFCGHLIGKGGSTLQAIDSRDRRLVKVVHSPVGADQGLARVPILVDIDLNTESLTAHRHEFRAVSLAIAPFMVTTSPDWMSNRLVYCPARSDDFVRIGENSLPCIAFKAQRELADRQIEQRKRAITTADLLHMKASIRAHRQVMQCLMSLFAQFARPFAL